MSLTSNKDKLVAQYKWINLLQKLKKVTNETKRLNDTIAFHQRANALLISRVDSITTELEKSIDTVRQRIEGTRDDTNELIDRYLRTKKTYETLLE